MEDKKKEEFLEWLEEKKYKIIENKPNNNEEITIYFNETELITLEYEENGIKIINPNEVLYEKYLKGKSNNIYEIKKYLEEFKNKIEDEQKNSRDEEEEKEIYDSDSFNYMVREIPQATGFSTLMEYFDRGLFVIPKNQRNYVWTKEQVENLAISLIRGFPIPPLYGYRNSQNQLVILDGQQRLISLYLYSKDRYLKNTSKTPVDLRRILKEAEKMEKGFLEELREEFGLRNERYFFKSIEKSGENEKIEKELEITYSKLDEKVKRIIDFRTINVIEIMVQGEGDREEIFFKIFGNLNQGGTLLKNQELRNGIYQCEFYDMLHDINNNNKKWREVFGPKHKHSRDVELLLRFAATDYMFEFKEGKFSLEEHEKDDVLIERFENSYPKLLNNFSKIAINFSSEKINDFKNKIEKFLDKIEEGKNIPNLLLEGLYLASIYVKGDYTIEDEFVKQIEDDLEYKKCIGSSSSSKSKVQTRIQLVYDKLNNKYGGKGE